jgi:hypothetical protein
MAGLGDSKEEAHNDLRERLAKKLENDGFLPRPGRRVPLEFACFHEIKEHTNLTNEFLRDIVGFQEGTRVFVSDKSSLWDFNRENDLTHYFNNSN